MASRIEIKERFENKYWRLNNLYQIIDKKGKKVRFQFNSQQERLFNDLWYLNILLKARQFGGTTFVDIYFLDECIFNANVESGIIAHNKEDAQKIFRRKVKFPYDNLLPGIKERVHPTTDSRSELAFNNGSIIYVGTSMRSGTCQYLHISEHGKICKKYPEKAEEIKTGSLNAIDAGQIVVIESTAEGAYGDFYDFCRKAKEKKDRGDKLTKMDYKFHFFAWFETEEYRLNPKGVEIDEAHVKYFDNIEKVMRTKIDDAQRAWYVKKEEIQGQKMKQEYPSTPDEAFEAGGKGLNFYREHHVIEPIPVPDHAPIYFTFDYGFAAPYSCGYWWVDGDNRLYRFSELYGKDKNAESQNIGLRHTDQEIAQAILAHEEQLGIQNRKIIRLSDPTCFNKKPDYKGGGQGPPTSEIFGKFGIYMSPGDPDRINKIRQFRNRLTLLKDAKPMMLIYNTCKEFIRTIPLLRDDDKNPEDIDSKMEDHIYDETCHICQARPISLRDLIPRQSEWDRRIERLEAPFAANDLEDVLAFEHNATMHMFGQDDSTEGFDEYVDTGEMVETGA